MQDDAMAPPEQHLPRPTPPRDPALDALQARLSLPIVNDEISLAALTHKSFVNEHRGEGLADNERLEFLGDAVIDLAVSHRLMERFPEAHEGDLSKMRASVVDEQGLSSMARALDLGSLLRLGRGEELTGGRQKASLLADAMEAVIAAVFVGSGLGAVLGIVDRFLGEAFARAAAGTLDRDFKTQLQELAQSTLRVTPRYRVVAEHGPDHSKIFEVEVDLRGEVLGRGRGRSKKDSEQGAARLALDALGRRLAGEAAGAGAAGGEGVGADSGTAEGGGAMAFAPEAQVGPAEHAVANAPELRPGSAASPSAPASESPGGGAPVEGVTSGAATQPTGPAVAARNAEDRAARAGGAEA